jgi:hypothetical protein
VTLFHAALTYGCCRPRSGLGQGLALLSMDANGGYGEGFRMPACRNRAAVVKAGVRKPPRKEPAGAGRCGLPSMGI